LGDPFDEVAREIASGAEPGEREGEEGKMANRRHSKPVRKRKIPSWNCVTHLTKSPGKSPRVPSSVKGKARRQRMGNSWRLKLVRKKITLN
jgi:hypothetical protein